MRLVTAIVINHSELAAGIKPLLCRQVGKVAFYGVPQFEEHIVALRAQLGYCL